MWKEITAQIKITRDGVIEIPCDEVVTGDEISVRLVIEELLIDGEEAELTALAERLKCERAENPDDFEPVSFEPMPGQSPETVEDDTTVIAKHAA